MKVYITFICWLIFLANVSDLVAVKSKVSTQINPISNDPVSSGPTLKKKQDTHTLLKTGPIEDDTDVPWRFIMKIYFYIFNDNPEIYKLASHSQSRLDVSMNIDKKVDLVCPTNTECDWQLVESLLRLLFETHFLNDSQTSNEQHVMKINLTNVFKNISNKNNYNKSYNTVKDRVPAMKSVIIAKNNSYHQSVSNIAKLIIQLNENKSKIISNNITDKHLSALPKNIKIKPFKNYNFHSLFFWLPTIENRIRHQQKHKSAGMTLLLHNIGLINPLSNNLKLNKKLSFKNKFETFYNELKNHREQNTSHKQNQNTFNWIKIVKKNHVKNILNKNAKKIVHKIPKIYPHKHFKHSILLRNKELNIKNKFNNKKNLNKLENKFLTEWFIIESSRPSKTKVKKHKNYANHVKRKYLNRHTLLLTNSLILTNSTTTKHKLTNNKKSNHDALKTTSFIINKTSKLENSIPFHLKKHNEVSKLSHMNANRGLNSMEKHVIQDELMKGIERLQADIEEAFEKSHSSSFGNDAKVIFNAAVQNKEKNSMGTYELFGKRTKRDESKQAENEKDAQLVSDAEEESDELEDKRADKKHRAKKSSKQMGIIVGVAVGSFILIVVLAIAIYFICCRKKPGRTSKYDELKEKYHLLDKKPTSVSSASRTTNGSRVK